MKYAPTCTAVLKYFLSHAAVIYDGDLQDRWIQAADVDVLHVSGLHEETTGLEGSRFYFLLENMSICRI